MQLLLTGMITTASTATALAGQANIPFVLSSSIGEFFKNLDNSIRQTIENLTDDRPSREPEKRPATRPPTMPEHGLTRNEVRQIQILLTNAGYAPGVADGIPGPATRQSIRQYQKDNRLPADGQPSRPLLDHLAAHATPDLPQLSAKPKRSAVAPSPSPIAPTPPTFEEPPAVTIAPSGRTPESEPPDTRGAAPVEKVLAARAELLAAPDPFSDVVTKLRRGTRVSVLERTGDWVRVESPAGSGYLYADQLQ